MDFPISSQFYQFSSNLPAPINVSSTGQSKEGYLAVGTSTAPSYPLDIVGTIQVQGFKMTTGAGADKVLTTDASGIASWQTPAGGSLWIQTGDDIYYNTGKVGIGVTSPSTKLDVAGAIKIGTQSTSDTNTTGAIRYDSTAKKFYGCTGTSWLSLEQQSCGYAVTFNYKGSTVTYGTVYNPATGRCWMDRNIGASQVATAYNDANAYGDLFQWGREADGHQVRSPAPGIVEGDMSLTSQPGHANFITEQTNPLDWALTSWTTRWLDAGGVKTAADPCPSGWRVPARDEWNTELLSWSFKNTTGAFASPLKLTAAGYLHAKYAPALYNAGAEGYYWSSTIKYSGRSEYLRTQIANAWVDYYGDAYGLSVRCIKD